MQTKCPENKKGAHDLLCFKCWCPKNAWTKQNAPHLLNISCVYTKDSLACTQEISCACTTLLCIHKRILLCMHKRSRVYTRDSFVYTQEILSRWGACFCFWHLWTSKFKIEQVGCTSFVFKHLWAFHKHACVFMTHMYMCLYLFVFRKMSLDIVKI